MSANACAHFITESIINHEYPALEILYDHVHVPVRDFE